MSETLLPDDSPAGWAWWYLTHGVRSQLARRAARAFLDHGERLAANPLTRPLAVLVSYACARLGARRLGLSLPPVVLHFTPAAPGTPTKD